MGIFNPTKPQPGTTVGGDFFTDGERERVDALWRLTALPRFAAAEDAARLTEVMSFALAVAVVAERFGLVVGRATAPGWCPLAADVPASAVLADVSVPCSYGALLLARLTGDAGLAWLGQEPVALTALVAYFGPAAGELREIAAEAERRVGHALVRMPGSAVGAPERELPDESGATGDDADSEPERVGGDGAGWRWINWVRDGLREGRIAVNAEGGWLHNIAGEAYVVVPDGFEEFAGVEGVEAKTVRNRVVRLGRHRERGSRSGAANTFRAELADGRQVEGMVFPGELVWDGNTPPPAAEGALGRRRR